MQADDQVHIYGVLWSSVYDPSAKTHLDQIQAFSAADALVQFRTRRPGTHIHVKDLGPFAEMHGKSWSPL